MAITPKWVQKHFNYSRFLAKSGSQIRMEMSGCRKIPYKKIGIPLRNGWV